MFVRLTVIIGMFGLLNVGHALSVVSQFWKIHFVEFFTFTTTDKSCQQLELKINQMETLQRKMEKRRVKS